jgi:hypothetical protein
MSVKIVNKRFPVRVGDPSRTERSRNREKGSQHTFHIRQEPVYTCTHLRLIRKEQRIAVICLPSITERLMQETNRLTP